MNRKKKPAVLKAKKGLDGFFTPAEAAALRAGAALAAVELGLTRGPLTDGGSRGAPFHANGAPGRRETPRRSDGAF